jgi:prepilin-type N-terminal cleavage/methylation domain-containing protein
MKMQWSVDSGQWSAARPRREHAFAADSAGPSTNRIERAACGERWRTASKAWHPGRRGFSLVEVLLAMFILGIGMIMVASVFPVGANWTRQTTEESNAQTVVQNALSVLGVHYGPNGDLHDFFAPNFFDPLGIPTNSWIPNNTNLNSVLKARGSPSNPFVLQAFPLFANIPLTERAYQFGNAKPFPAANPMGCTYFWTALIRLNPMHRGGSNATNGVQPSASYTYDVYILVFRKGAVEQKFSVAGGANKPGGYAEIPGTRNMTGNVAPPDPMAIVPSVGYANYAAGQFTSGQWTQVACPPIGQYGIGANSGTVFRQVLAPAFGQATPRPGLMTGGEPVVVSPAADGASNTASPLIYVYQTTMSF